MLAEWERHPESSQVWPGGLSPAPRAPPPRAGDSNVHPGNIRKPPLCVRTTDVPTQARWTKTELPQLTICHPAFTFSKPQGRAPRLRCEWKVDGRPRASRRPEDSFRSLSGNPVAPGPGRLFISKPVIDFGMKKIICYCCLRCHREKKKIHSCLVC